MQRAKWDFLTCSHVWQSHITETRVNEETRKGCPQFSPLQVPFLRYQMRQRFDQESAHQQ